MEPIVSLDAQGNLYRRKEGVDTPYDFNAEYAGYYPSCRFTAVLCAGGQILLAGVDTSDLPHLFLSLRGSVWEERSLVAKSPLAGTRQLTGEIGWIFYEEEENQFYLVTKQGEIAVLPDCPKCMRILEAQRKGILLKDVEMVDVDESLGPMLRLTWEDGNAKQVPLSTLRQYRVSLSYGAQLLKNGAVLVDVRNPEEAEQQPYTNSIPVPLENLMGWLEKQPKHKTILFVCRTGRLADEAAQTARTAGFHRAFSLGGTEEWAHVK